MDGQREDGKRVGIESLPASELAREGEPVELRRTAAEGGHEAVVRRYRFPGTNLPRMRAATIAAGAAR